jgi:ribosomal protein S6
VKQYEALIILHNTTKEEGIKEALDLVSDDIQAAGGTVDNVQKMDRKPFARVSRSKSVTSGFYANVIFSAPASSVDGLLTKLSGREEVYRVVISKAHAAALAAAAPAAAAAAL